MILCFCCKAATREVEKDFQSVYSRLVLCKTYRLDEDGKVLTPEEVLFRVRNQFLNNQYFRCYWGFFLPQKVILTLKIELSN